MFKTSFFRLRRTALVFALFAALCPAADWSSIYDTGALEAQKDRLQTTISLLLEREIMPFVSSQQAMLLGLQDIDLPLSGFRSDPLDFYAQNRRIVLPIRTLLFLEDLSRSYGWMWANRYTTKTADEYLSMLRYRGPSDFVGGKYPAPRQALHVPENALGDPRVVEASVRLRKTAFGFILLHQYAHVQLHHEAKVNAGYSEAQEEEADQYALDIMKNNSVPPTGVLLVMQSAMFFEAGEGDQLHPVTPQRLEAMAHYLDARVMEFIRGRPDKTVAMDGIHSIAMLLVQDAEWLTVRGHQQELQQLAMKTDPTTLQPRPLPKTTR